MRTDTAHGRASSTSESEKLPPMRCKSFAKYLKHADQISEEDLSGKVSACRLNVQNLKTKCTSFAADLRH